MKGMVKAIIAGAVIIGIGVAVILITYAVNDWDLDYGYDMKSYTAEGEITRVDLEFCAGSFKTEYYDGDKITIDYPENSGCTSTFSEEDGVLKICAGQRKWYTYLWWFVKQPQTVLKIPYGTVLDFNLEVDAGSVTLAEGTYGTLSVKVNAGKLEINGATCENLALKINAGSLYADDISCGNINAEVNAGSMELNVFGTEEEYTLRVEKNAGSCNVSSRDGSGEKYIKAEINAGHLDVNFIN